MLRDDHRLRIGILLRAIGTAHCAVTIISGSALQRSIFRTRIASHFSRNRKAGTRAREREWAVGIITGIDGNWVIVVVLQRDGGAFYPGPSAAAYISLVAH